jgi:hypothetical protein
MPSSSVGAPVNYPGAAGTLCGKLREFGANFRGKRFDYVDLAYDTVRDTFRSLAAARSALHGARRWKDSARCFGEDSSLSIARVVSRRRWQLSTDAGLVQDLSHQRRASIAFRRRLSTRSISIAPLKTHTMAG